VTGLENFSARPARDETALELAAAPALASRAGGCLVAIANTRDHRGLVHGEKNAKFRAADSPTLTVA
jgi:hypothetical protein